MIGDVKRLAKETLKTSVGKCGLAIIIFYVCALVVTALDSVIVQAVESKTVSVFFYLLGMIAYIYILLGMSSFFLKLAKGEDASVSELFKPKENFLKYLVIDVVVIVVSYLCTIIIDNLLFKAISTSITPNTIVNSKEFLKILATSTIAFIPGMFLSILFSQVKFIFLENPDLSIIDLVKQGIAKIKGYKFKYLLLLLSFIGWFLLIAIIGILFSRNILLGRIAGVVLTIFLTFYLVPYIVLSQAYFYNAISNDEDSKVEETSKENK